MNHYSTQNIRGHPKVLLSTPQKESNCMQLEQAPILAVSPSLGNPPSCIISYPGKSPDFPEPVSWNKVDMGGEAAKMITSIDCSCLSGSLDDTHRVSITLCKSTHGAALPWVRLLVHLGLAGSSSSASWVIFISVASWEHFKLGLSWMI